MKDILDGYQGKNKLKYLRNNYNDVAMKLRIEKGKLRHRQKYLVQQAQERKHERRKKRMILESEMKRRNVTRVGSWKGQNNFLGNENCLEGLKINLENLSSIEINFHRNIPAKEVAGDLHWDIDPEDLVFMRRKINLQDLNGIKINIHRSISATAEIAGDLQRDIIDPEEVVVKRRMGEGSKPIFEREEIKKIVNKAEDVQERRSIFFTCSKPFSKQSNNTQFSSSLKDRIQFRQYRDNFSRCIKRVSMPIPVSAYYRHLPGNSTKANRMAPVRTPVPILSGDRYPSMKGAIRSFPPRFIAPNVYRFGASPNYRFGPI